METINPSTLTQAYSELIAQVTIAPSGGRLVAISGQAPVDRGGKLVGGDDHIEQARQCFRNVDAALRSVGATADDVFQMRIYIVRHRQDLVPLIFAAGRDIFGYDWPVCASAWLGIEALAMPEWLVEIEITAVKPDDFRDG